MRNEFGPSWMPAPISPNASACSSTLHRVALARQHQRGGQAADAAAGDEERKITISHCFVC